MPPPKGVRHEHPIESGPRQKGRNNPQAAHRNQTYNSDAQIGDSAACATALLCGVKTNFGTLGVDNTARFNQCESLGAGAAAVPSLVTWAQEEGG
uniref:alkaline phosphatase n=1 Tax=Timema monikensis TaxID=170555 RepID=A0A7R9HNK2_9NEOP|nr:unnamed protein product [Timema monikensis]